MVRQWCRAISTHWEGLLDFDSRQKLGVHPWTPVCTQTDKPLKPPKKKNFDIELHWLLPLKSSGLTDNWLLHESTVPSIYYHHATLPHPSLHACQVSIPQLCYCRPCVLVKYFLVAQRHFDFNGKWSIHSSFFSSAFFFPNYVAEKLLTNSSLGQIPVLLRTNVF